MADSPQRQGKNPEDPDPASPSESSAAGSSPLKVVDVPFPPVDTDVSKLVSYCDNEKLPVAFGKNVPLEKYNDWLGHSETGLRVSYDMQHKYVILREGCAMSHGTTRTAFKTSLETAFAGIYAAGNGRIKTPADFQDFTPDCWMGQFVGGNRHFPVLAEVGASQTEAELNSRATDLLAAVPGVAVVVLIKTHDDASVENGRMYAWCVTKGASGEPLHHAQVEFGRVGAGVVARAAWFPPNAPPTITVPAHNGVDATSVSLGDILVKLRDGGGFYWEHPPPP